MATKNLQNIVRWRARLVKDPSNLSNAFPHGGTELGIVRSVRFQPNMKMEHNLAVEFGKVRTETFYTGEAPVIACVLREFDADALSTIWPNTANSGSTMQGRVSGAFNRSGYAMSNNKLTLLWSPYAVDDHKHILFHNAIPMVELANEIQASIGQEVGIAVAFSASPDSTGRTYDVGLRANLSL